jgi:hypothetical protein
MLETIVVDSGCCYNKACVESNVIEMIIALRRQRPTAELNQKKNLKVVLSHARVLWKISKLRNFSHCMCCIITCIILHTFY